VRINSPKQAIGQDDVQALWGYLGTHCGLVVPKADRATLEWLKARGVPGPWLLLVESARAIWELRQCDWTQVAEQPMRLAFGSLDYQEDLGIHAGPDEGELLPARIEVVTASRVWGLPAPIDGIYGQIHDAVGLAAFAQRSHRLGFAGMLAIHPAQLDGIHRAFAPAPEEVAWARRVLEAWQEHQGAMTVDGMMVDKPVVDRARRILQGAAAT
jgi:citrate lyase subunit beta/citryl-CoA lyase